jgi:hypothetical protein
MWIIGFNFINDSVFMMPVTVKVVGEKNLDDLIISQRGVMVASIRPMNLCHGYMTGYFRKREFL